MSARDIVQQYKTRKSAGSLPNLAVAQTRWLDEVAKQTAAYWSRVGGGWSRFNIKATGGRSPRVGMSAVELKAEGWSGQVKYEIKDGKIKVDAFITIDKALSREEEVDFMEILRNAPKPFDRTYKDTTMVQDMIKDVSLHFSGLIDQNFGR